MYSFLEKSNAKSFLSLLDVCHQNSGLFLQNSEKRQKTNLLKLQLTFVNEKDIAEQFFEN